MLYCKNCCNRKLTGPVFGRDFLFNDAICDFCNSEFDYFGSFYSGKLCNQEFLLNMKSISEKMSNEMISKETKRYLDILIEENAIEVPFTFNTHLLAKKHQLKLISVERMIKMLRVNGFKASKTHFDGRSLRTDAGLRELLSIIEQQK